MNPNLPFILADHIAFAQQREKQGIRLAAPLHYDVQHLYPREYELRACRHWRLCVCAPVLPCPDPKP